MRVYLALSGYDHEGTSPIGIRLTLEDAQRLCADHVREYDIGDAEKYPASWPGTHVDHVAKSLRCWSLHAVDGGWGYYEIHEYEVPRAPRSPAT